MKDPVGVLLLQSHTLWSSPAPGLCLVFLVSQVGILVDFPLVSSTGLVERLRPHLLLLMVATILSRTRTTQVLLQKRQRRVSSACLAVAGRTALHLVHGLGHGRQGGRGRVGVQVGR